MIIKAITDRVLPSRPNRILLPADFQLDTMRVFLTEIVDDDLNPRHDSISLDFSSLLTVKPVGIVVLSNAIEFLRSRGVKVHISPPPVRSDGVGFLDDSMFFQQYLGRTLYATAKVRPSTMPLKRIHTGQAQQFLHDNVMPWIAGHVGMTPDSLSGLRAAIEEILHNVKDHSGHEIGCTFAQFYPREHKIHLAISDFGRGIPTVVRTKVAGANDAQAISMAFREGFTTQSNVKNRGAGLPNLIRWVANNKGTVIVASGRGQASAVPGVGPAAAPRTTFRMKNSHYPGTLVSVILRTDTLERAMEDAQQERFEW